MKKEKTIVCRDINNKIYRVPLKKIVFSPSVYAVIINKNKILLSKKWDGYDLPGGKIDVGEKIEEALKREVWEETGLVVEPKEIIHSETDFFKMPYKNKFVQGILLYYLCQIKGGKISTENLCKLEKKYADKPEWIPFKMVSRLKIYDAADYRILIKKAIKLCQK